MLTIEFHYSNLAENQDYRHRERVDVLTTEQYKEFFSKFKDFLTKYEDSRERLVSTDDIAAVLEVSRATVYSWMKHGLPYREEYNGQKTFFRFYWSEVSAWIKDHRPQYYKLYLEYEKRRQK